MGITKPKYDRRLIGEWKSDRKLTLKWWKLRDGLSKEKAEKFKRIFGKLAHRFTRNRMYSEFDGFKSVDRYKIIAADEDALVIALYPLLEGGKPPRGPTAKSRLLYLKFVDETHYCLMAPRNLEYFKRTKAG
jgi:hypothetical protein